MRGEAIIWRREYMLRPCLIRCKDSLAGNRARAHLYGAASIIAVLLGLMSSIFAAERSPLTTQPASNPAEPMWVNHIEPILSKHCMKCHGGERVKGGLDLRRPQAIFAGGTDGSAFIPGRPSESPLYQRLAGGVEGHMPPEKEPQLSAEEGSFLREWIAML